MEFNRQKKKRDKWQIQRSYRDEVDEDMERRGFKDSDWEIEDERKVWPKEGR